MAKVKVPDVMVIGQGAVCDIEEMLRSIHTLYEENRKILFYFSLSAPPPVEKVVEKLIQLNEIEIETIAKSWRQFFQNHFAQPTEQ